MPWEVHRRHCVGEHEIAARGAPRAQLQTALHRPVGVGARRRAHAGSTDVRRARSHRIGDRPRAGAGRAGHPPRRPCARRRRVGRPPAPRMGDARLRSDPCRRAGTRRDPAPGRLGAPLASHRASRGLWRRRGLLPSRGRRLDAAGGAARPPARRQRPARSLGELRLARRPGDRRRAGRRALARRRDCDRQRDLPRQRRLSRHSARPAARTDHSTCRPSCASFATAGAKCARAPGYGSTSSASRSPSS